MGTQRFARALTALALLVTPAVLVATGPAFAAETSTADPVRDLGAPLTSLTVMYGVTGTEPDGSAVMYAVPAGENARLNVVDLRTRQLKRAVPLPGASGSWAVTVATDGRVYVGAYSNGHLYRYSPDTGTVADLGQPIPGETYIYGLTAGDDGVVYGGTYPHAHAFRYDPASGAVTDYGSLDPVQQYARASAYDPDRRALFVGLATPYARLLRIDVATGERREITPAGFTGGSFFDLNYAGGRVFGNVDGQLVVFDAATGAQVTMTGPDGATTQRYPIAARGVSPANAGGVYFTTTGAVLTRYDIGSDTVRTVTANGSPVVLTRGVAIGYGWFVEDGRPVLYGLAGNYSGGTFRFDPVDGTRTQWSSPFQYVPSPLQHLLADPAGGLYVNAFLNGTTGRYDPATGQTATATRQGQVEDWTWGEDGLVYVGIYPYGRLSIWDPAAPGGATNPRELFSLETTHHQNRPVSVVKSGGKLYVGTTPGYGLYGGALSVYDLATATLDVYRNIVADQTIAAVLPLGDAVWAGSSVDGGQGTEPVATEARLVRVDPANGQVAAEYRPVPGAQSINELSVGPDGRIWGLADGTVFALDPATGRVARRIPVFTGSTGALDGALVWQDGYLNGVSGGRLFVVDSFGGTATVLRAGGLNRLVQTPDGTLYTLLRPAGGVNYTNLGGYQPPADGCPGSDLRGQVWTGDVNSGVANRFASYGCTVADVLPSADEPNDKVYLAAVAKAVVRLVGDRTLTPREGAAILVAAGRSR